MIDYSVIVPAYNAADVLPRCLAALERQTIDRARYQVIVVDDGSTDRTLAVAEQAGAQVIRAAHGGPASARNIGARAATGGVLLFTDADCEPSPDWIERMACAFDDPQVAGAKGTYRTRQTALTARFVQQEYEDKYDRLARRPTIDFIDTYSAAYRREVFLSSGGFDVTFTTSSVEDQELSFRLAAQGHRLVFVPDAIVGHRHDATPLEYLRRKAGIGYWKALLLRRHPDKALRDSHTPQVIKAQIGLLALSMVVTVLAVLVPTMVGWLAACARACLPLRGTLCGVGSWLLLFLTMLPLLIKIARRDPAVVWIAPMLIVLRAAGLGIGLAIGLLRFTLRPTLTRALDANL